MDKNQRGAQRLPVVLWIVVGLNLAIGVFSLTYNVSGTSKIVYVDSQKLVNGYKGMQAARKEFEAKSAAWKSNLDTLRTEAEIKIKEYESNAAKLSARERALMEELIRTKQEQYMNYQQVVSEKIKTADQELTSKVLSQVNDYIKKYGNDHGYAIILAATQYGNIAYGDGPLDITEDVLKGLNAEYAN
jgi:outer membrane protein